jgi:type II secretory pathway component GspD/PulD (secretin)
MKKIIVSFLFIICIASLGYGQQISSDLRMLLSTEGKIMYGDEPNSIVVIDYPENIQLISDYLNVVDISPQQVLIEARVIEVRLKNDHSLGINWNLFAEKGGLEIGQFRINSSGIDSGGLQQSIDFKTVYKKPGDISSGDANPFTLTVFDENINVVLKAMATVLDTDILSAPRIATVNNRQAQIKIIQSYPWAEPQVETSDSGATTVTWTVHFEEIGILLNVTPTINEDGNISMILQPEVSEKVDDKTFEIKTGPLATDKLTYYIPIIDKRNASTKVVVGNGQTLIIGGLIKDKIVKNDAKIPLMGDLPMLGYLFKSKNTYKEKIELLILVSPTIITSDEIAKMAKTVNYGINRQYKEEEYRKQRMALSLEAEEKAKEERLTGELQQLTARQKSLLEESKKLEEAVLKEEKNLKVMEVSKDSIIEKRKGLIKK